MTPVSLTASQEDWEGEEENLGRAEAVFAVGVPAGCRVLAPHVSPLVSQQPQVH